jgi:acyl carrier protein
LDFFILCSSINSVIGGAGQVDYCAANAFLDAFAAMKSAAHSNGKVISVNWSAWKDVGMAVETEVPAHLSKIKEANLRNGLLSSEGVEVFNRILANPQPQVIVSPVRLEDVLDAAWNKNVWTSENNPQNPLDQEIGSDDSSDRLEKPASYIAPTSQTEKTLTPIWESLLGVKHLGINDNFFELGGHSLMATQILSRIRDIFKVNIPLRTFFEANTIAELSKQIDTIQWIESNQHISDQDEEDREEIDL